MKTETKFGNIEPHTRENCMGEWPCNCKVYGRSLEMDWCPIHAAATELLEAAKSALFYLDAKQVGDDEANKLRAAIAKARSKRTKT